MDKRVVVGMSGGVDSSCAAALLKRQGYDVIGITLDTWRRAGEVFDPSDAAAVCDALDIPHHVLDIKDEFYSSVVVPFIKAYEAGKTPNPCTICNKAIKFPELIRAAQRFGAESIATGHYGEVLKKDGRYMLRTSPGNKDQTYFLYGLSQEILSVLLLPLSGYQKEDVRRMAEDFALPVARKKDSQEICFVLDDYGELIEELTGKTYPPGDILNRAGERIGGHKGLIHYTVGQRKGLGAFSRPMFVSSIDGERNSITLCEKGEEYASSLVAKNYNFQAFQNPPSEFSCEAKIRFRAKPAACMVKSEGDRLRVTFSEPQRAITPGQSVVFYEGSTMLGGAEIELSIDN